MKLLRIALACAICVVSGTVLYSIQWGPDDYALEGAKAHGSTTNSDIHGTIVCDGTPALRKPHLLRHKLDNGIVETIEVPDLSVIIDPKSKAISSVLVVMDEAIPSNKQEQGRKIVNATISDRRFTPRLSIVPIGHTLRVTNREPFDVPIAIRPGLTRSDGLLIKSGEHHDVMAVSVDRHPRSISSDIYPWLTAFTMATDKTAVVTDTKGRFTLPKTTSKVIRFKCWHEVPGWITRKHLSSKSELVCDGEGTFELAAPFPTDITVILASNTFPASSD